MSYRNESTTQTRKATATLFVAAPILPGKVEGWRRFCQEIDGWRQQGHAESRQRLGIVREAVWLVHTPGAHIAVVRIEAEEPEYLLTRLVASDHSFDRWFKEKLHDIYGLDLTPVSLGPMMELVFDWQQTHE